MLTEKELNLILDVYDMTNPGISGKELLTQLPDLEGDL